MENEIFKNSRKAAKFLRKYQFIIDEVKAEFNMHFPDNAIIEQGQINAYGEYIEFGIYSDDGKELGEITFRFKDEEAISSRFDN